VRFLLTGATGFLGSFLLSELLRQYPAAHVHALVRGANDAQARQKLIASLSKFGLWDDALAERIHIVNGDLARPLLGLTRPAFQRLSEEIDAVYHNGAWVNLFYAYSTLKPANVLGTQEVLRLASLGRPKPVHYVSTTGVFFSAGGPALETVDETTDLEAVAGLMGGYAQSKWVAEKLVHLAGERGLPVTVYRPGRIGGHSQNGLGNADDLVFRILKGSIQLGAAPELDLQVEMSPVDYVSRALVHLSQQPDSVGRTFHLVNPDLVPWSRVLDGIDGIDTLGQPLRRLAWNDWQAELRQAAESSTDNVLFPLLPVLAAEPSAEAGESADEDAREPRIACGRTLAALAGSGVDCPPLDERLVRLYFDQNVDQNVDHNPRVG
jgi:thioester reductase-like protein